MDVHKGAQFAASNAGAALPADRLRVHSQFIWKGASSLVQQRRVERLALEKSPMFKKIAAFGLSAALVLSPLAALAQTDTTAPAAPAAGASTDAGSTAKPMKSMKKHPKKHTASKKMKKPAAPAAPAAPAEAPKS